MATGSFQDGQTAKSRLGLPCAVTPNGTRPRVAHFHPAFWPLSIEPQFLRNTYPAYAVFSVPQARTIRLSVKSVFNPDFPLFTRAGRSMPKSEFGVKYRILLMGFACPLVLSVKALRLSQGDVWPGAGDL